MRNSFIRKFLLLFLFLLAVETCSTVLELTALHHKSFSLNPNDFRIPRVYAQESEEAAPDVANTTVITPENDQESQIRSKEASQEDVLDAIVIDQEPSKSESSLSISPAILEQILDPGVSIETKIYVINGSSFPLPIKGTVQNLTVNEKPIQSRERINDEVFNSSSWFRLEPSDFIIQPGEEKEIKVFIDTPRNAEPGGHYATIFFQPLIPQEFVSATSTQLTTKVGVVVLSIVKGDIVEKAQLGKIESNKLYKKGPIDFTIPVFNDGNIHVLPSGKLFIRNSKNEVIHELPIKPGTVLPHTQKDFVVTWDKKNILGKYSAVAEVKYGSNNAELISNEVTFWVIPWVRIILSIILLTAGITFFRLTRKNFIKALKVLFES